MYRAFENCPISVHLYCYYCLLFSLCKNGNAKFKDIVKPNHFYCINKWTAHFSMKETGSSPMKNYMSSTQGMVCPILTMEHGVSFGMCSLVVVVKISPRCGVTFW